MRDGQSATAEWLEQVKQQGCALQQRIQALLRETEERVRQSWEQVAQDDHHSRVAAALRKVPPLPPRT